MPKATKKQTATDDYVRQPWDACDESAAKLNVVIRLLHQHDCPARPAPRADDDLGYDLCIARDALTDIRDMLRAASLAHGQARKAARETVR